MADLPMKVQRQVTLRDRIRQDSLRQQQKKFKKRGEHEKEALGMAGHVAGRTDFDRGQTAKINPSAKYHYLNETLRGIFYRDRWKRTVCQPYSIFLSQGDYPLKGFHYLLQALPRVLEQFPETHVYVAGSNIIDTNTWQETMKLSAYGKYLRRLIKDGHLDGHVTMLGRLAAEDMKAQFLKSHLFVLPSALENSPNSLGEAMLLGVPCVAADVGGVHNLLTDGGDGMLYPAGDVEALADRIMEVFTKEAIVERFSDNARKTCAGEPRCGAELLSADPHLSGDVFMTFTFVSNYINHHQMPLCEALRRELGDDFTFIQTMPMEEERVAHGVGRGCAAAAYVQVSVPGRVCVQEDDRRK